MAFTGREVPLLAAPRRGDELRPHRRQRRPRAAVRRPAPAARLPRHRRPRLALRSPRPAIQAARLQSPRRRAVPPVRDDGRDRRGTRPAPRPHGSRRARRRPGARTRLLGRDPRCAGPGRVPAPGGRARVTGPPRPRTRRAGVVRARRSAAAGASPPFVRPCRSRLGCARSALDGRRKLQAATLDARRHGRTDASAMRSPRRARTGATDRTSRPRSSPEKYKPGHRRLERRVEQRRSGDAAQRRSQVLAHEAEQRRARRGSRSRPSRGRPRARRPCRSSTPA